MLVTIAKSFIFDAAHHLPNLPATHKCHRMHGHTYQVEVQLCGLVDPDTGFLVDYAEIERVYSERIHSQLDHRVLNEVRGLEIPSTEVLAPWIAERLARGFERTLWTGHADGAPRYLPPVDESSVANVTLLWAVRVKESASTWCEVTAHHLFGAGRCAVPAAM